MDTDNQTKRKGVENAEKYRVKNLCDFFAFSASLRFSHPC
jgi:hypothetical protein